MKGRERRLQSLVWLLLLMLVVTPSVAAGRPTDQGSALSESLGASPLPDKFLFSIGNAQTVVFQFASYPSGVAVAPDGTVYVASDGVHCIQRFSADGGILCMWRSGSQCVPAGLPYPVPTRSIWAHRWPIAPREKIDTLTRRAPRCSSQESERQRLLKRFFSS